MLKFEVSYILYGTFFFQQLKTEKEKIVKRFFLSNNNFCIPTYCIFTRLILLVFGIKNAILEISSSHCERCDLLALDPFVVLKKNHYLLRYA